MSEHIFLIKGIVVLSAVAITLGFVLGAGDGTNRSILILLQAGGYCLGFAALLAWLVPLGWRIFLLITDAWTFGGDVALISVATGYSCLGLSLYRWISVKRAKQSSV